MWCYFLGFFLTLIKVQFIKKLLCAIFTGNKLVDGVYTYKFTTETGTIGHGFVHLVR